MEVKTVYVNDSGVRRTMVSEDTDPTKIRVFTEVEMSEVLESNKRARELHPTKSTNKLVAKGIPMTVYEKSILEGWDDDDWKKWLNDPDNKAFRIWEGRV